jgi:DNA-directed RNA polymerase specialized sigma24 family protein
MAAHDADAVADFETEAASLRSDILAHCYRMLGSWDDAEDAVQETYLRGFRGWEHYERRASPRTWLCRIATNVCLNAARDRARRALPSGIGAPDDDPGQPVQVLASEHWVQPFADDRADLRPALIAGIQTLPAVLRADTTLELVPARSWYDGKATCSQVLADAVGNPGDWRMTRTMANGQPAVAAYLLGEPLGIAVLDVRRDGIAGITVFGDPGLVDRFTG